MKKVKVAIMGILMSLTTFGVVEPAAAKRTAQEQELRDAERATKTSARSSERVRLQMKLRLDEEEGDEATEVEQGRELAVKYRVQSGKTRLDAHVEGYPEGTLMDVYIGDLKIGSVTVEALGEGELTFNDTNWPTGLPLSLPAGTEASFVDAQGASFSGTLEAK